MKFDIHIHSDFSQCSSLALDDILKKASAIGLQGLCITDHDTMEAKKQIKEGLQDNGLFVIIGIECTTVYGDFLVFGDINEVPCGLGFSELHSYVTKNNGILIAAHPARKERPVNKYVFEHSFCNIIESINGRNSDQENSDAFRLAEKYSLKQCGGSDAHTLEEIGNVVTVFPEPVNSRGDFIRQLSEGQCKISVNPAVTMGKIRSA